MFKSCSIDSTHYRVNREVRSFLPSESSQTKSKEETWTIIILILTDCESDIGKYKVLWDILFI